jgi:HPr kinase/phosphorylase
LSARQAPTAPVGIHASAVVIAEAGVLIRGASGLGKSALALTLITVAANRGWSARLVGDDRIEVSARSGRVVARGHAAIAGRIERRGQGVVEVPFAPAAVVRLVVDLLEPSLGPAPRVPDESEQIAIVAGLPVPRLVFDSRSVTIERCYAIVDYLNRSTTGL